MILEYVKHSTKCWWPTTLWRVPVPKAFNPTELTYSCTTWSLMTFIVVTPIQCPPVTKIHFSLYFAVQWIITWIDFPIIVCLYNITFLELNIEIVWVSSLVNVFMLTINRDKWSWLLETNVLLEDSLISGKKALVPSCLRYHIKLLQHKRCGWIKQLYYTRHIVISEQVYSVVCAWTEVYTNQCLLSPFFLKKYYDILPQQCIMSWYHLKFVMGNTTLNTALCQYIQVQL